MKGILRRGALSIGIGSLFPVVYLVAYELGAVQEFPRWGGYLWPSSIFLMATGGAESDSLFVAEVIALSLLANAILWLVLGLLCFGLFDFGAAAKGSGARLRDSRRLAG
jgi:hypothetical protein